MTTTRLGLRSSPRRSSLGLLTTLVMVLGSLVATPATSTAAQLPDLVTIVPTSDIVINHPTSTTKELRYSHIISNFGVGPLEIHLVYDSSTTALNGFQRIYSRDSAGNWSLTGEIPIQGTFIWDSLHGHYHFPLAQYGLYSVNPDGSLGAAVALSPKILFCIADSYILDPTLPNAGTFPYPAWHCGLDPSQNDVVLGISVGGGDEYDYADIGQSIDITNVPDGTYWLVATTDPNGYLTESDTSNNTTAVKIRIVGDQVFVVPLSDAGGFTFDHLVLAQGVGTVTTSPFSTSGPGRLLAAFVSSQGGSAPQTVTVSGAGLVWTLASRANAQSGTAEIWTAFAPTQLTNVVVTSQQAVNGYSQALSVLAINGASGVGATAAANGPNGPPSVLLTTTLAGSWVFGVGYDSIQGVPRTVGPNQTLVQQWLNLPTICCTTNAAVSQAYWTQATSAPIPQAGTVVQLDDTHPVADGWNFAAVEILLAGSPPPPPPPPTSDFSLVVGPGLQSVVQGSTTSYTVSVTPINGFTGSVNLSVSGLPSGSTATFSPNPTGSSSTLTITTSSSDLAGSYSVRVTGVNGSVTHTATATLVVTSLPSTRPFGVDQFVFSDGSGTRTTPPFTTSAAGELVLAFAASGGPLPGTQSLTVSGAGLTWSLVARANAQGGTAEIWQAVAPTVLSNATVTSVQSLGGGYHQSLTVVTVSGAAGTGAAVSANGPTGAPLVTLTTTRPGSLVYGVGNDWDRAVARTLGPNQTLLHQVVDTATADTFWSQYLTAAVSTGGAAVQLNDTAPTSDKWNFTAVEILASGSPLATVPNVVGMTQTAAAMNIANAGLTLGTVTNQPSATVPAGSVISQSPAAGATASPQSAVNLTVSSGPPPPTSVQVPSVVGLTQAAATTVITSANLTVGTIGSSASPSVPAGSVISQNPAPGTAVAPGSAVNLVVSTGPPPVTVPNVVGMTQTAATAAIVGAGLKAGTVTNASSTSIPAGSVISQDPAAGASVALGSAVALVVSSGPAAGLTVASIVFSDGSGTRTTTPFSTAAAGEILLAFVASDGPASGTQSVTVTGAGLSWTLVNRANQRSGTAEIWQATADTQLSGVTVSSTQSAAGYHQSLTVIAFTGAGAIGASAAASGPTGGPAVSVTTTKAGSLVYGVGNDWDHAIARTVGANQQIVHQWVDTSTDDTYWVQATSSVIPGSGTAVLLDVTAPTTDQWNMVAVEILAQ